MDAMTLPESTGDVLAESLIRIAIEPDLTRHLHSILGEFCHQARNHLNSLKMSLYLSQRSAPGPNPAWDDVEARYIAVELQIDRLHRVCRPVRPEFVSLPFHLLIDERWETWAAAADLAGCRLVRVDPGAPLALRFDVNRVGHALDELIRWRARVAPPGSDLRLSWCANGASFELAWEETTHGPTAGLSSVDPAAQDREADGNLILPLIARIAVLHGGHLARRSRPAWGLTFTWPLVP